MLRNYFKIAFRNLQRNRIYSFINIAGLALGMTCALFIFLWVKDELNFNRFHENESRIFRLMENQFWGDVKTSEHMPWLLASALKEEFPEVSKSTMLTWDQNLLFTVKGKSGKETGVYSNADLFEIFSFPLVEGDYKKLSEPSAIIISETVAKKFFPRRQAIGQTIRIDNSDEYQVAAVMKDIPKNSSLKFDFVLPAIVYEKRNQWAKHWGNHNYRSYVLLNKSVSEEAFERKIKNLLKEKRKDSNEEVFLQPFSDMYLYSNFKNGKQDGGRIEYVRLFSAIAIIILVIACINFMNLTIARSGKRAREIGVRKVTGAGRKNLMGQFLGESVFLSMLALVLSITAMQFFLPAFNQMTGKHIRLIVTDYSFLGPAFLLAVITGLIAGSYPAFFLSSLKPVTVLKNRLKIGSGAKTLRKVLVVFQFSISILLILGTVVVHRQISYVKNKNLGIDKQNLLYVNLEGELYKYRDEVEAELLKSPEIQSVTTSSHNPISVESYSGDAEWSGKPADLTITFAGFSVGYDFLRTMGIQLKDGRDFSPAFKTDSVSYIVNETAAKVMNMKDPVGQNFSFWNGKGRIVGVMRDFHLTTLHKPIAPLVIQLLPENSSLLFVKIQPGKLASCISKLESVVKKFNPAYPFEYHFLDEDFEQQYKSEAVVAKLANSFTFLAIFIACMGLFGLTVFITEQRTKEIGILKVLGASVVNITRLLSIDFIKLVLVAIVIGSPIAWAIMNKWLQTFAYRIEIEWWLLVMAGVTAIFTALLTVSFQTVKAAIANPVKSLRSE